MFSKLYIALFTILTVLLSFYFLYHPALVISLKFLIVPLLGLIMFMMGTTLTIANFTAIIKRPFPILLALLLQFLLMPLLAYLISLGFALQEAILIGMIVVGASPGGTASNVITFLAKGDVALSVTITACSTLLSFIITPILINLYIGDSITFSLTAMLITILKMVIIPILLGMFVHHYFKGISNTVAQVSTPLSLMFIAIIIALVLAINQEKLQDFFVITLIAVILHNILGLLISYFILQSFTFSLAQKKAIVIEVGMQNSALAMIIASKFFGAASALPAALFSLWHNISGILLAYWWSKKND
jgi:BASS family bile acid:Na+ symporter